MGPWALIDMLGVCLCGPEQLAVRCVHKCFMVQLCWHEACPEGSMGLFAELPLLLQMSRRPGVCMPQPWASCTLVQMAVS